MLGKEFFDHMRQTGKSLSEGASSDRFAVFATRMTDHHGEEASVTAYLENDMPPTLLARNLLVYVDELIKKKVGDKLEIILRVKLPKDVADAYGKPEFDLPIGEAKEKIGMDEARDVVLTAVEGELHKLIREVYGPALLPPERPSPLSIKKF